MSVVYEQKAGQLLDEMKLTTAAEQLDTVAQQAAAKGWSYTHFLGYLLDGEQQQRHTRKVALNMQFARFPYIKTLKEFDYAYQPSIDQRLIEELATGRYLTEGRNIMLLGPPGVGKTHLAIGLGVLVAQMGHRVYFTNAIDLAAKLTQAVERNTLHRQLNALNQPKLLIIDEMGYLNLDNLQASLLFQVICKRYQKGQSIAITSNKAFTEWGAIFSDDAVMASAILDRLLHKSTVINIKGDSYRLKEKKMASTQNPLNQQQENTMK